MWLHLKCQAKLNVGVSIKISSQAAKKNQNKTKKQKQMWKDKYWMKVQPQEVLTSSCSPTRSDNLLYNHMKLLN